MEKAILGGFWKPLKQLVRPSFISTSQAWFRSSSTSQRLLQVGGAFSEKNVFFFFFFFFFLILSEPNVFETGQAPYLVKHVVMVVDLHGLKTERHGTLNLPVQEVLDFKPEP